MLGEVVVTATRYPAELRWQGGHVTIINREEIRRSGHTQVGELLRSQTGLDVARTGGSMGGLTDIRMRGANNQYTQILVDGMEINDPSDQQNSPRVEVLSLTNVKRIEIIRGPQSVVHGSDAMAGTINIITRDGTEEFEGQVSTHGGSWNTWEGKAGVFGPLGETGRFSLSGSMEESDGFSAAPDGEDDAFANNTLSGNASLQLTDALSLAGSLRYQDQEGEFDDLDFLEGEYVDADNLSANELFTGTLNLSYSPPGSNWDHDLGVGFTDSERKSFEPEDSDPDVFQGQRRKAEVQSTYSFWEDASFTLGMNRSRDEADIDAWTQIDDDFTQSGYFSELQVPFAENGFATIGARLDHHEEYGLEDTYRLNLAYFPDINTSDWELKLRGSGGTGFKAPTVGQLFDPTFGNEDLDPEISRSWEVGFELYTQDRGLTAQTTFFNQKIEDQIVFGAAQYDNIDSSRSGGVETSFGLPMGFLLTGLHFTGNYTNYTSDDLRIPRSKTNLSLRYALGDGVNFGLSWYRRGEMDDISPDGSEEVTLDSYSTVNANASYQAGNYRFFGRVDNLTDEDFEEVAGFNSPPRFVMVGLEAAF